MVVSPDDALQDAGVDSLAWMEVRRAMQRELGEAVKLPQSLIVEYPTAALLSAFVAIELQHSQFLPSSVGRVHTATFKAPVVISGMACRLPEGRRRHCGVGLPCSAKHLRHPRGKTIRKAPFVPSWIHVDLEQELALGRLVRGGLPI